MTSLYIRDFPPKGWTAKGKLVLPPNAFVYDIDWLEHLASIFPLLKKRIPRFDILSSDHIDQLVIAAIQVLNKKYFKGE